MAYFDASHQIHLASAVWAEVTLNSISKIKHGIQGKIDTWTNPAQMIIGLVRPGYARLHHADLLIYKKGNGESHRTRKTNFCPCNLQDRGCISQLNRFSTGMVLQFDFIHFMITTNKNRHRLAVTTIDQRLNEFVGFLACKGDKLINRVNSRRR
ncbi:hypothetical protein D3C73_810690 [compost metagenome]